MFYTYQLGIAKTDPVLPLFACPNLYSPIPPSLTKNLSAQVSSPDLPASCCPLPRIIKSYQFFFRSLKQFHDPVPNCHPCLCRLLRGLHPCFLSPLSPCCSQSGHSTDLSTLCLKLANGFQHSSFPDPLNTYSEMEKAELLCKWRQTLSWTRNGSDTQDHQWA